MAVSRQAVRFWATAVVFTLAFAAASAAWFPYGALRLDTAVEQRRVWLLTLWTAGLMAVLFGASGLLAFFSPLGFREVHEAGSLFAAMEARRRARASGQGFHGNFAWWLICTGGLLIGVYFFAWALRLEP